MRIKTGIVISIRVGSALMIRGLGLGLGLGRVGSVLMVRGLGLGLGLGLGVLLWLEG